MKVFTQYSNEDACSCYGLSKCVDRVLNGQAKRVYATTYVDSEWWEGHYTGRLLKVLSRGVIFER